MPDAAPLHLDEPAPNTNPRRVRVGLVLGVVAAAALAGLGLASRGSGRTPSSALDAPTRTRSYAQSFVVLLADDLGWGDVGYQGGPGAATPRLDALARDPRTLVLSNFHATVTCSPSRAALLTGRAPTRDCVSGPNDMGDRPYFYSNRARNPLRRGAPSVARAAQRAGWATGFFGKWHLGPLTGEAANSPTKFGFDDWVASVGNVPTFDPACFDDPPTRNACERPGASSKRACEGRVGNDSVQACEWSGHGLCGTARVLRECRVGPHNDYPASFQHAYSGRMYQSPNGDAHALERGVSSAAHLANVFEAWVRSKTEERGLLAVVAFHEPHAPFIAPLGVDECSSAAGEAWCRAHARDRGTDAIAADYYGAVREMDAAVGRILDALQRERGSTVAVLFASDNGPETRAYGGFGSSGPFRGHKRDVWEGGHRVPALLWWPAAVKTGGVVSEPVSIMDWAPTVRAGLGLPPAAGEGDAPDGVPLQGLARDPRGWRRPAPFGVCSAHLSTGAGGPSCTDAAWIRSDLKLVALGTKSLLFNLTLDVGEAKGEEFAASHPELVGEMRAQLDAWTASVTSEGARRCGRV